MLEEAKTEMMMMEDAAMNCPNPMSTAIDDVRSLLINMKKGDRSRNEKKKGKRKRDESSEEEESDRETDPNSKRVMKKIKAVEDSVKEVTRTINAIAWRDRRDTQSTGRDCDCDRDRDRSRGQYNDNGRRQDYRNGNRNGPQRSQNCQKPGHHHTNCHNPAVCFN